MDFRAHTLSQIWAGRRGRNEPACHHNNASSRRNHLHLSVCLTDRRTRNLRERERESHRGNGSPRATKRPTSPENTARLSRLGAAAAALLSVFPSPASHHNFAGGAYVNILPSSLCSSDISVQSSSATAPQSAPPRKSAHSPSSIIISIVIAVVIIIIGLATHKKTRPRRPNATISTESKHSWRPTSASPELTGHYLRQGNPWMDRGYPLSLHSAINSCWYCKGT